MFFKYLLISILLSSPIYSTTQIQNEFIENEFSEEILIKKTFPLHEAVKKGDISKVKSILDNGYDIEQRMPSSKRYISGLKCTEEGETPLDIAITNKNLEIVKLLLDRGANPYHFRDSTIDYRKQSGKMLIIKTNAIYDILQRFCSRFTDQPKDEFYKDVLKYMSARNIDLNGIIYHYNYFGEDLETPIQYLDKVIQNHHSRWEDLHDVDLVYRDDLSSIENLRKLLIELGARP